MAFIKLTCLSCHWRCQLYISLQSFSRGHRCTSHGGLLTYVDESINTCALDVDNNSQIWEGMFLLIKDNHTEKETILGNIYRPPHDNNNKENVQTFVSELNPVLSRLSENNRDCIMAGDYNINLLHIYKLREQRALQRFPWLNVEYKGNEVILTYIADWPNSGKQTAW